jgi:hypothetical protein
VSFQIEIDYHAIDAEMDRIGKMPDAKTSALLRAALEVAFANTQATVHVRTGSLRASGKTDADKDEFRSKWEGVITYGGPSSGKNNPVDYAIYEKARGEEHNFLGNVHLTESLFVSAMKAGLRG